MELLRFLTSGNVDDGKSTLIGRLLIDSGGIPKDEKAKLYQKSSAPDVSRLLDGLKDEQEQGITIDVAYRFFTTQSRRFIIADCPGHFQYTRNLLCAASQSDVALVIIDVTKGIQEQTRRHISLMALFQVPHVVFCINKMDAISFDQSRFDSVKASIIKMQLCSSFKTISFIPLSALFGDNIVKKSLHMSWYEGPTLLKVLEAIKIPPLASDHLRFVVQKSLLPSRDKSHGMRAYAGRILSGQIKVGQPVQIFPSSFKTKIKSIFLGEKALKTADSPASVAIFLEDEFDLTRGSLITNSGTPPTTHAILQAQVFWLDSNPAKLGKVYDFRHSTQDIKCQIAEVLTLNLPNQRSDDKTSEISLNNFGTIKLKLAQNGWFDSFDENRNTGVFLLVDPITHSTSGVGFIRPKTSG